MDAIYMDAVQALTRQRRLADERVPHAGRRALLRRHLLPRQGPLRDAVVHRGPDARSPTLWETGRGDVLEAGAGPAGRAGSRSIAPRAGPAARARSRPRRSTPPLRSAVPSAFDAAHGGWGGAPKFPQPTVLEFVLRRYLGDRRRRGCCAMVDADARRDGARRHLRPARRRLPPLLDRREWLVPHFEKMLYDNAQLARLYLHALAGHRRRVATGASSTETLDYVAREMRDAARRVLLSAGRRHRGRGGTLLRLDARGDPRRARRLRRRPGRRRRAVRRRRTG